MTIEYLLKFGLPEKKLSSLNFCHFKWKKYVATNPLLRKCSRYEIGRLIRTIKMKISIKINRDVTLRRWEVN